MKFFHTFADHPFGAWVINVLSVVAGIIGLKLLASKLPDGGLLGAFKATVNVA